MSTQAYYTLGRSGLRVSRLSLGTMTFGTEWGWGADKAAAQRLFDAYLDAGGNFIDTADVYTGGTSEQWLGDFVAARKARDQVVLATKFTFNLDPLANPNAGGNGRKNILRAVEDSLKRLGTDYIDLYYLHTWDMITQPEEVMRTLDDLVRAGKIRHIGLSDVPAWYAARAQTLAEWRGWEPVTALQLQYSLAERNLEHEYSQLATGLGMGITAWSPLASGLLSGKYRSDGSGAGRLEAMRDSPNPVFRKFTERNWAIVAELEKVANEIDQSMAAVALNWVANRPGVGSVIVGATSPEQLNGNLRALDFTIPAELLARLNAASAPETPFPYYFFDSSMQGMMYGGATVGDKPAGYTSPVLVSGSGAGVS
ncbi:Predicted oxidoreductase [Andreprevotia lacus DSM 23236]|jgi:aryl-alcohol dehydrogenase-like predicted oxidoreductase|uniref:Predicted oxidoreductase n=1 Tax=Andreprevotia lacus DSM 23236 TaxID=1121001 RepID=A0A1W1XE76_9NEIS|nr:aldo/keto reductase [Andreprevotia lacus]SMC22345.1 Predicted oxidoreductase [Andreprevotia lacus DSM 23236]